MTSANTTEHPAGDGPAFSEELGPASDAMQCPECSGPLADNWHGYAACFCAWGGRTPTLFDLDAMIAAHDGPRH